MKKIYSAFISSVYESLLDERREVIEALLDFRILPIGMEHFTVPTSDKFLAIQELIDDSDFFIMLLGSRYGSRDQTDADGRSWTQREYEYAQQKEKPTIVILCDELIANLKKDRSELTEDEQRQVEFSQSISFAKEVSDKLDISTIINQFLHTYNFARCTGWSRIESIRPNSREMEIWKEKHSVFDISGSWHHVHLSEDDPTYIRIGTIKIEQDFAPDVYKTFQASGLNYNVEYYDKAAGVLRENKMKNSSFTGQYTMEENGTIFGVFRSKRSFKGEFDAIAVNKGERRGLHDFTIRTTEKITTFMEGDFHDEAPSPKHGRIFLFRDVGERDAFLLENRKDFIEER